MDQGMQSQLGAMEVESLQAMVKQTEAKLQELSVEHDRMIAEGKEQQQVCAVRSKEGMEYGEGKGAGRAVGGGEGRREGSGGERES